jgi:hypothetical protein
MGKRKLDDPHLQARLLGALRGGHGKGEACHIVGITPATFRAYYKANPDFREDVEDAINESIEPVIATLRELAIDGDVTAAKEYLRNVAPPPRSEKKDPTEINVNVRHEIDPGQINDIRELEAMVRNRAALPAPEEDYEDAEILDD